MRRAIYVFGAVVVALLFFGEGASAASLKIQPLLYREHIEAGEKKRGFVDISNPSDQPAMVKMSVQGFRQIDDEGNLEFYDNPQVSAGIVPEITEAELMPKDVLRLSFEIDSTKLPSGDVFAALFVSTTNLSGTGTAMQARVGTLFVLENGLPPSRDVRIVMLETPFVQTGTGLQTRLAVQNTAPKGKATGFFPVIKIETPPYGVKEVQGPLVFAGRTRMIEYRQPGDYFGFIRLTAKSGTSEQSRYVFAITGYWRWLTPLVLGVLISAVVALWVIRKRRRMTRRGRGYANTRR